MEIIRRTIVGALLLALVSPKTIEEIDIDWGLEKRGSSEQRRSTAESVN